MNKKQIAILQNLAAIAEGRSDHIIELAKFSPGIAVNGTTRGLRFADIANPQFRGGSEMVYCLNALRDRGLIDIKHSTHSQGPGGGLEKKDPGIVVTVAGFDLIEKQPAPDCTQAFIAWFRSNPWSIPVIVVGMCVPTLTAIVQIIQMLVQQSE